jgi:predicted RNA-binding Zn ribbon-like protein
MSGDTPGRQLVKLVLMETATSPRELPIVGGHLALDFANTVDDPLGPARHDHASTYDDLVRWSLRVGSVGEEQGARLARRARRRPAEVAEAMATAHLLRDDLNAVFGAIVRREEPPPRVWRRVRDRAADALAAARLTPTDGGGHAWTWVDSAELVAVLHPVAAAAADLLVSDDLARLKQCARCPWLFLDVSRNHSRRWCDMDDCGRAQKIERYVARRRSARSHSQG